MNFFDQLWSDVFTLLVLLVIGVWIYMRSKGLRAADILKQLKELGGSNE